MNTPSSILANRNVRLLCVFLVAAIGFTLTETLWKKCEQRHDASTMRLAAGLAREWFERVGSEKEKRGIVTDAKTGTRYSYMLGDDWSSITTTLGALEAKEIAADPDFAALVAMWLGEAGLDSTDRVGVMLSGSFPSLAISTFAALRTLGMDAVVVSSLGSSCYGANQPRATWIDIESWLAEDPDFGFRSSMVTMGAEGDAGGGLSDEGIEVMRSAAVRNGVKLYLPESLEESIAAKTELFERREVSLVINIGGNQASMGGCPHSTVIPNGFNRSLSVCGHRDRGVISRLADKGMPYIHLLNIRDLANRYRISSGFEDKSGCLLYSDLKINKIAVLFVLFSIAISYKLCYNFCQTSV